MKKIITLLLAVLAVFCFASCGNPSQNPEPQPPTQYTVTFVQSGCEPIQKTVNSGETLTDIPNPQPVTGYDVVWDTTDFTNITANKTVTATITAKTYTVTYNAEGGEVSNATQTVTYDANYTLLTPTKTGFTFICWKNGTTTIANTGTWQIADNVTLTAVWEEVVPGKVNVTFVQTGYEPIIKKVDIGGTLTDIPNPQPTSEVGYEIVWDRTDFTNITADITVNAVKSGKTYTVTFNANGGSISSTTQQVKYGESYTLATPTHSNNEFEGWFIQGTNTKVELSGTWNISENVTLVAQWGVYVGPY